MKTLITGASSGIGLELARIFARERSGLVLVARGQQKLEELAAELRNSGVQVQVIAKDLAGAGAAEEIQREAGPIDILVNNAGFGSFGEFANTPLTEDLNLMRVNMEALVGLTKLFLPGMIQARSGRILNVASTAAFQPGPLMALYYASKAFVLSFSEAIANELHGTGVTVTVLCPGPTVTDFQRRANMAESGLFKRMGAMDARSVAEAGYRGLMAGRTIVIPGMKNRMLAESVRFAPRKMVTAISRKMQDRV